MHKVFGTRLALSKLISNWHSTKLSGKLHILLRLRLDCSEAFRSQFARPFGGFVSSSKTVPVNITKELNLKALTNEKREGLREISFDLAEIFKRICAGPIV